MKKDLSYDEAYARLEKLVHDIEDDSIQLDTLADKVTEATKILALCETKLRVIETEVAQASKAATREPKKS